jgi:uncharacterized protein (DUF433 family)
MDEQTILERIIMDPKVMAGKPVIKGTRLTVDFILNLLAHGKTNADIMGEYGGLAQDDINACLVFATKSLEDLSFMPLASGAH